MASVAWLRELTCQPALRAAALGFALSGIGSELDGTAHAWPDKTVRLVTPAAPGGHTDSMARILAEGLGKKWGRPVVAKNQPGADGILAVRSLLAIQDDHALFYTFNSVVTVNPALHERLPYSPKVDLVPISHVVEDFIAIVASPALEVSTLADLQAMMRAKPGSLNYASFPGSPYLVFQAFQERMTK